MSYGCIRHKQAARHQRQRIPHKAAGNGLHVSQAQFAVRLCLRDEREMIQREVESTDRAIDSLVCELYGLTEEEIKIVEG